MRIVLFYSLTESFNYFTDQLVREFQARGHETFVLDLPAIDPVNPATFQPFIDFISRRIDAVVCFDGLGLRQDMFIEAWDSWDAVTVDILMDPPLRFHPTLERHPRNYLLYCCDRNHVDYVKRYFAQTVTHVDFMPHVGVMPDETIAVIPWEKKKYDILFSGTYYQPEARFGQLSQEVSPDSHLYRLFQGVYTALREDSDLTVEQAVRDTMARVNMSVSAEGEKTILRCSESVDWAIRMYQRERVVQVLADAGFELHLLGRGWENHPSASQPNVHRIDDRIPYGQTLAYMADARLNLNVMPGFKAGTHDRIFNTLLQHSLPLTDSSAWIDDHFTDGEDIALYNLKFLEQLPFITERLLADPARSETMIQRGYEKVAGAYTWTNCADWILTAVQNFRLHS